MIIDKIENIGNYSQIPPYAADFVKQLSKTTNVARYKLNDLEFINVETYTTKRIEDAKYESHNKFIDIQLLLEGKEQIYIKSANSLIAGQGYNEEKDIQFYDDEINSDYVTLDGSNFVLIYPYEAHAPQVAYKNERLQVKKAVVKLLF